MKILKIFSLVLSTFMVSGVFASDMKVGFIYIGPPGDHGWNYQHDVGRQAVDEAFGGKVETICSSNFHTNAKKGLQVMETICDKIKAETTEFFTGGAPKVEGTTL